MEQNLVTRGRERLNGAGHTAVDPILIADVVSFQSGKTIALGLPGNNTLVVLVPRQEITIEGVLCPLDHGSRNGRAGGKVHVRHPHGNGIKSFLWSGRLVAPNLVADAIHGNGIHAAAIKDGSKIVLQNHLPSLYEI